MSGGNHPHGDCRDCAAQRAEIKRMCEERDSAQRCIEKLTARVAELEALTPPGHVLVGPDARERIARAITRSSPTKLVIGGASIDCVDAEAADEMASRIVNGFLAALGVRGGA